MNPEALESDLSPAGLDRCAAMRAAMLEAFTAMHRARRRRRRASALAAALLLLGASAWLATHLSARPGSAGEVAGAGSLAPAARSLVQVVDGPVATVVVEFALVVDGGDSLVREVDSAVSFVEVIGNDELVRTLAEMDRPAGLMPSAAACASPVPSSRMAAKRRTEEARDSITPARPSPCPRPGPPRRPQPEPRRRPRTTPETQASRRNTPRTGASLRLYNGHCLVASPRSPT